jgi:hypothetical protein
MKYLGYLCIFVASLGTYKCFFTSMGSSQYQPLMLLMSSLSLLAIAIVHIKVINIERKLNDIAPEDTVDD